MSWTLPVVARDQQGILDALNAAPMPNQGGYATEETSGQFTAARDAATAIISGGHVGIEGIFTVELSGHVQEDHGPAWDIPLEEVTIIIARHAPLPQQTFEAGPISITLTSGPTDPADQLPIEAVTLKIARHRPMVGRRSYQ